VQPWFPTAQRLEVVLLRREELEVGKKGKKKKVGFEKREKFKKCIILFFSCIKLE